MHNIPFSTEPDATNEGTNSKLCQVPIQKETPSGLVDTVCKGDIEEGSAGLCRYKNIKNFVIKQKKPQVDKKHVRTKCCLLG